MNSLKQKCNNMGKTQYTKNEQYAIVSILILIMEADGVIDPNEVKFLNNILENYNITEQELDIVNSLDFNKCCEIIKGMNKDSLGEAKNLFINMAKCDGYADPRELEIIEKLER